MRAGSLFSGVGGFDLGFEREGIEIAWQCENDPYASQVLAHHWPHLINHGDIHELRDPEPVDLLVGGFPCQDYSKAGRGAGLAGDRGALWWQYHRVIADVQPTWVVGENVDGLTHEKHLDSLATIISSLTELGYGVAWAVLDSQHFGVPQRRRRLFIVGHSGGRPRPSVLALAEGLYGDPRESRQPGEDVTGALTESLGSGGPDAAHALAGWIVPPLLSGRGRGDHAGQEMQLVINSAQTPVVSEIAQTLDSNARASQSVFFSENQRNEVRELEVAGPQFGYSKHETFIADDCYTPWPDVGQAHRVYNEDGNGPALARHEVQVFSQRQVRRLTPVECERLQGFPDGWTEGVSDSQRYSQMGNAVTVNVAQWLAQQIQKEA